MRLSSLGRNGSVGGGRSSTCFPDRQGSPIKIPQRRESHASLSRPLSKLDLHAKNFYRGVRERDRRCLVTGTVGPSLKLEAAAHIFPLAHLGGQQQFADDKYDGETGMHSVQNGILLDCTVCTAHIHFDKYLLTIDPDLCITRISSTS
ncbi:hypothetical protein V8E53_004478 [Lactarius tabidus]